MPAQRTAEQLYTKQFLRSLRSTSAPSPLTTAQASKAVAKAWAGAAENVRQKYEEMAHPQAMEPLQRQLAKKAKKSAPLPAFGQAGVLPGVFVVRWELLATLKKFDERTIDDEHCDYVYADTQDRTRNHHEMQVVGSSADVYSTVTLANAAADAQFGKLRHAELASADERRARVADWREDWAERLTDEVRFKRTTPDGMVCWNWKFAWSEGSEETENELEHFVKQKDNVHVVAARFLADT